MLVQAPEGRKTVSRCFNEFLDLGIEMVSVSRDVEVFASKAHAWVAPSTRSCWHWAALHWWRRKVVWLHFNTSRLTPYTVGSY